MREARARRALTRTLGAAALGALPLAWARDPLVFLAWLALTAAPLGAWLGATCDAERDDETSARTRTFTVPLWPWAALVPGAWMIVLAALAPVRSFPTPHWAAAGWCGLFAAGFGLGRLVPRARAATCALLVALALVLAAAPAGFGLVAGGFTPEATARWLDLSPVTVLAELAGVDWLRHPAVYEPARTLDIGPELRGAYRGALAGPLVFLIGCALAAIGAWLRSRPSGSARRT